MHVAALFPFLSLLVAVLDGWLEPGLAPGGDRRSFQIFFWFTSNASPPRKCFHLSMIKFQRHAECVNVVFLLFVILPPFFFDFRRIFSMNFEWIYVYEKGYFLNWSVPGRQREGESEYFGGWRKSEDDYRWSKNGTDESTAQRVCGLSFVGLCEPRLYQALKSQPQWIVARLSNVPVDHSE